jgi:hypothetical protein
VEIQGALHLFVAKSKKNNHLGTGLLSKAEAMKKAALQGAFRRAFLVHGMRDKSASNAAEKMSQADASA